MRQEAVKAGFYESPAGANFPKIQILTVEDLLDGSERPRYPDLMQGGLTLRKSKSEVTAVQLDFRALPAADSAAVQTGEEIKEPARRKGSRVARGDQRAKARKLSRKAG